MFQIEISLKFTVNHGPVSPSNFFYFLSFLSFLSSQGGIKLGWQNSEQLADIGLLVRTIVCSFTSCGRSFVITYAASARMSQYFLSSSFAPHTCVVLIYLLSFLPEIKTHKTHKTLWSPQNPLVPRPWSPRSLIYRTGSLTPLCLLLDLSQEPLSPTLASHPPHTPSGAFQTWITKRSFVDWK